MKKKWIYLNGKTCGDFNQIFRTMKLITLFLFVSFFQLSAATYSQSTRLKISGQNLTLGEIFEGIEKQSEFSIFYNVNQIDLTKRVDINADNQLVDQILDGILLGTGMTYTINNKLIVIYKQNDASSVVIDQQQDRRVTGKVTDQSGTVLPGVTIVVKGTATGVITDSNGNYSIANIPENAILLFSFVGMKSQEVVVGGKSIINVALAEESIGVDEVVVVGYGTQKRVNLTGAVSSANSQALSTRASANASTLLQGRLSGLEITQPSGQPGRDDAIMKIRGLGSFGASSAPLVLVDGVIGSISNLAPNDIKSITILKDAASASIYGARAANGVILVTTKQAQRGTAVEYQLDMGVQSATRLPKLVTNSAEYMEMYNSARVRAKQSPLYTQQQIDAYRNATDKEQYPNFDWLDYYFNPASTMNHYLSISNVTDKSSFKLSLNYLNQDGILPNINFKRYNTQLNFTNQLTKAIKVGTNLSAVFKDNHEPPGWVGERSALAVYQAGPNYKPFLPDGSGRKVCWAYQNEGHNVTAPVIFDNGERLTKDYGFNGQIYFDIDLYKGLKWTTTAAVNYAANKTKDHFTVTQEHYFYQKLPGQTDYTLNPTVTGPGGGVTDNYSMSILPTVSSVFNYETKIGANHNLRAMAGYEQQSYYYSYLSGNRKSFPTTTLKELAAGSTNGMTTTGSASEWSLRSFFGRVGYDFNGKYLLEVNARYDGTSRVAVANRWGFFPSVSAGWRLSEENFMKGNSHWLDNLKLRGSYGVLGNQEIGNYPYQDILNLSSYPFDGSMVQAAQYTRLTDKNLRWESTKILDFGLDLDLKNGLFGMTLDWFKKNTYNILATLPVPSSLGLSGPVTNDGELQNIGYELELRHRNQIGEITYDASFMLSAYKNELLSIVTPTKGVNEVGLAYGSFYKYEFAGVFDDQADIDNSPKQVLFTPQPGDVKVKDQNGDKTIDAEDRVSFKPFPDFTYSFGFNVGWKGFTLSTFFQGVQGLRQEIYGWGFDPFVQMDPPNVKFRDSWSLTNPTSDIPAVWLGSGGTGTNNGYTTTYHLPDASYLRLKNVNLSYNLPKQIVSKLKLHDLTIILSGDNLLTFTKYPGVDPENGSKTSSGASFPQVRILNLGVKIQL